MAIPQTPSLSIMSGALPMSSILRDPTLRSLAALLVLWGAVVCSFGPYTSVLAVQTFDLGNRGYAVLLTLSSVISVGAALWVGIRADQTANRRGMALATLGLLIAGVGVMSLWPSVPAFLLAHVLLLPMSGTLWGQLFAMCRLAASVRPEAERDTILATMRALFALPFVLVMPLWAAAFSTGLPLLSVYPVALILGAIMLAMVFRFWPRDGQTDWADVPSGLSFRAALAELANPGVAFRVVALGAVSGAMTAYMAILSLVLGPEVGRGPADVALYFGIVAGLEVPFMLALPLISGRFRRTTLILWGTLIYAVHLSLLPLLAGHWALWLLVLPAAVGGAAILTIPIGYLQDMLSTRPGTGAALMALQLLVGQVLAALCFAVGTSLAGYGLVAALSAASGVIGAALLHRADSAEVLRTVSP